MKLFVYITQSAKPLAFIWRGPLYIPHLCHHYGSNVNTLGMDGLSCHFSTVFHFRHAMLNDILHKALSHANVPSGFVPTGLDHTDHKHPSGLTKAPWSYGRLLVWEATCVDNFAPPHLLISEAQQQQTRLSRPRFKSTVTSTPMHTTSIVAFEPTGFYLLSDFSAASMPLSFE